MRYRLHAAALLLAAASASAQDPAPVYQTKKSGFGFQGDAMLRQEWTQGFVTDATTDPLTTEDQSRLIARARPRVEFGSKGFTLGVGGDFYYSNEDNLLLPPGQNNLLLIRDNFDSRSARLDLAFARLETSWLRLEAGRFAMPVAFTEMIWDRDLRAQGAAATLSVGAKGSMQRLAATGLYSRASHVFEDGKDFFDTDATSMLVLSGELSLGQSESSRLQLVGSYIEWDKLGALETKIRRQNTRVAGAIVRDYHVIDAVARIGTGGNQPIQLVANFCWNVADDPLPEAVSNLAFPAGKKGMWLAAILGSLRTSRARVEYVYAKVDRDATLAAYGADDFLWVTGWEGHKVDLGRGTPKNSEIHLVAQWQRFKDSPVPAEREHWVARYRIDTRVSF